MTVSWLIKRHIACCLALVLSAPLGLAADPPLPGATAAQTQAQNQATQVAPRQPANSTQSSPAASQAAGAQQQSAPAKPVGSAVAPYEKTTGVTGSRPAGAVIAPAKQRRVRAFLIKAGIVVGAGIAIGTVVALSHASPSRPN